MERATTHSAATASKQAVETSTCRRCAASRLYAKSAKASLRRGMQSQLGKRASASQLLRVSYSSEHRSGAAASVEELDRDDDLSKDSSKLKASLNSEEAPTSSSTAAASTSSNGTTAASAEGEDSSNSGGWWAALGAVLGIALMTGGAYVFRDQIKLFLNFFIDAVDDWGPWGYLAYAGVYTALEILAVPAIPLTMTAGVIFGPATGTAIVSVSGTLAATVAFLIARYAARDKVMQLAGKSRRWVAIDKAIGRDGLKFVTLLRMSPLLPLALSNYLYGLTSVDLGSYVLGSWLGMLPGTYAYVSAGHVGRAVLTEGEGSFGAENWQVGVGVAITALAIGFVGRLAQKAIEEVESEEEAAAASNGSSSGDNIQK